MTVRVQIETASAAGQKLITELRRYPDVVRFVEPDQVSEPVPEGYVPVKDGIDELRNHLLINSNTETGKKLIHKLESHPQIVKLEYPYPTDDDGMDIESLSANESAKLAFDRLGEKHDRKFNNKYTR
ncbi:MAG: hypothetical protein Q8P34_13360 [Bacteroidota bacterium]|nr:hypothetical protein [Bacteroidota bacterium]